MRDLAPSEATALILRVALPPRLEALRMRCVPDAVEGLPAHVTVAYPFAQPDAIDDEVVELVAGIAARHAPWTMRLVGRRRWPDTIYAAVDPEAPAVALQADLEAAFPTLPIYGGAIEVFVPHVTIAEGPSADDPEVDTDPGWGDLPVTRAVAGVELIVRGADGRWGTTRTFPMGDPGRRA
jgi:2'-5' RNA ligase